MSEMSGRLKFFRAWRVVLLMILAWNLAMGIWNSVDGHLFALFSWGCVLALTATIVWQTSVLRQERAKLRPRVDWPSVYRMEREVWGRTFEHDGAPGEITTSIGTWPLTLAPSPRLCPAGHKYTYWSDRPGCHECDRRHSEKAHPGSG